MSLKSTSKENISLVSIWNEPGFEGNAALWVSPERAGGPTIDRLDR
jgi:hypothetical protein